MAQAPTATVLADFEESVRIAWAVASGTDRDGYDEVTVCWEAIDQAAALLGVDIAAIRAAVEADDRVTPESAALTL